MLELDMKTVECVAIAIMWRSHTENGNGRMAEVFEHPYGGSLYPYVEKPYWEWENGWGVLATGSEYGGGALLRKMNNQCDATERTVIL